MDDWGHGAKPRRNALEAETKDEGRDYATTQTAEVVLSSLMRFDSVAAGAAMRASVRAANGASPRSPRCAHWLVSEHGNAVQGFYFVLSPRNRSHALCDWSRKCSPVVVRMILERQGLNRMPGGETIARLERNKSDWAPRVDAL